MDDEKLVLLTIDAIESESEAGASDGEQLEPATPLEIASRAQVDVATVNAALARLLRRGLVMPRPHVRTPATPLPEDSPVYVLTDRGRAELDGGR